MVKKPDIKPVKETEKIKAELPTEKIKVEPIENVVPDIVLNLKKPNDKIIETSNVTPLHDMGGGYVEYDGKLFSQNALKELRPDFFSIKADLSGQINTNFGTNFPKIAKKGDMFVRVDVMPNRIFKFDGNRWIETNKNISTTYLNDENYINFLIEKVVKGEYDIDSLTPEERDLVEEYLNRPK